MYFLILVVERDERVWKRRKEWKGMEGNGREWKGMEGKEEYRQESANISISTGWNCYLSYVNSQGGKEKLEDVYQKEE